MIKIIGIILIVFSTSYLGYYKAGLYNKRIEELNEFKKGVEKLESEFKFVKSPLYEAFYKVSRFINGNVSEMFLGFSNNICNLDGCSVSDIWNMTVDKYLKNGYMNKNDIKIVRDFGATLGTTDIEGQMTNIMLLNDTLEYQINDAYIAKEKNAGLYQSFGLYAGILISILLI